MATVRATVFIRLRSEIRWPRLPPGSHIPGRPADTGHPAVACAGAAGKTWTIERIRRTGVGRDLRPPLVFVAGPERTRGGAIVLQVVTNVWL